LHDLPDLGQKTVTVSETGAGVLSEMVYKDAPEMGPRKTCGRSRGQKNKTPPLA